MGGKEFSVDDAVKHYRFEEGELFEGEVVERAISNAAFDAVQAYKKFLKNKKSGGNSILVIDEYDQGRIHAGCEDNVKDHVTRDIVAIIENKLTDENTVDNPILVKNSSHDLGIFIMKEEDLFAYMSSRDASNYITGV